MEEVKNREDALEEVISDLTRAELTKLSNPNNRDYKIPPEILTRDVETVEKLREKWKFDRRVNIVLGRLYRRQDRLDDAIALLSNFIEEWKSRPSSDEVQDGLSVAFYNRACYYCLLWSTRREEEDLKRKSLTDLKAAIELRPARAKRALEDSDFKDLKDTPEFAEIVRA